MSKNNVIQISSARSDLREKLNIELRGESNLCLHSQLIIDEHFRILSCRKCEKVLDPVDWLITLAKKETRLVSDIKLLREELNALDNSISDLKREERNVKARLRNARKKQKIPMEGA